MKIKAGPENDSRKIAMRVSTVSIAGNVILSLFKLFAGVAANSGAMVSDAVHSASDVFSTVIVMIGIKFANKASDKEHQYGHERMECVAAVILAVILFGTGLGIGYRGAVKIFYDTGKELAVPGTLALAAAVISIAVKEAMYWYTRAAAKKIRSGALLADAWHHRSDALSSVGSFAGIFGARLGFPVLDPAASIVICVFILKAACGIFADAIGRMTDKACDDELVEEIRDIILSQSGVLGIDQLKTRLFGARIYVDVEIRADGNETLKRAHETAEKVHGAIEEHFPDVKHCMVHVNPEENYAQDR
ncbi:cation diffusion facilitator family transporter [Murimonas intestini]|uniref:cation diffusion facilitator family transporter n=1 Tax=Murimonas intestini TaxID=1337051 RepID=UPI001A9B0DA8|nr:cation diffusion facilitator family transporter [Murimonas intestini]